MALPKIQYPIFTTTVPSTGEPATFRPFNNGEVKILLTAEQGGEYADIVVATKTIIGNCFADLDVDDLTTYDIDYLFLQLRIKSVSGFSELSYRNMECEKEDGNPCQRAVNIRISLDEVKVQQYNEELETYTEYQVEKNKKHKIELSDDIGVFMKHPGFAEQEALSEIGEGASEEDLIKLCITSVYDEEGIYTRDDFSKDELDSFYADLPALTKKEFESFIRNIPLVRYETSFKCKECGFTESIVLDDLSSFFG